VNKSPHLTDLVRLLSHLSDIRLFTHVCYQKRQGGGIGSSTHDEKQASIKAFFGGVSKSANSSAAKDYDEESDHGASTSTY
jgi:hypothetical protein